MPFHDIKFYLPAMDVVQLRYFLPQFSNGVEEHPLPQKEVTILSNGVKIDVQVQPTTPPRYKTALKFITATTVPPSVSP